MTIVAAVDGEHRPDQVVATGAELAKAFDEELFVTHVMKESTFEAEREEREYYVDEASADAANQARAVAEATVDDVGGMTFRGRVGDPVEMILDEAQSQDARYLVIGGRRRTPVGKAVFGSTSQSLLLGADRPVLFVVNA